MDFFNRTGQSLTMASEAFRRLVTDAKPDLVVVDPLQSFLPADCNMAARNEMRAAVLPLAAVCKEVGAAGVIVQHTNKKLGVSDRQRLADSSDLWDQSRCVFLLGTQHSTGLVYASNEKNNYAPKLKTALMQVEQCAAGPRLTLHSYTDLRDSDFVKQRQGDGARGPAPALNQSARQALLQLLQATDTQRMESDALKRLVQTQLGCGRHTVDTAYSALVREGRLKKTMLQRPDGKKCWYTTVLPSPQAEQTTLAP